MRTEAKEIVKQITDRKDACERLAKAGFPCDETDESLTDAVECFLLQRKKEIMETFYGRKL